MKVEFNFGRYRNETLEAELSVARNRDPPDVDILLKQLKQAEDSLKRVNVSFFRKYRFYKILLHSFSCYFSIDGRLFFARIVKAVDKCIVILFFLCLFLFLQLVPCGKGSLHFPCSDYLSLVSPQFLQPDALPDANPPHFRSVGSGPTPSWAGSMID